MYSNSSSSRQAYGRIGLYPIEVSHAHVACFGQWNETESDVCHFYREVFSCQC